MNERIRGSTIVTLLLIGPATRTESQSSRPPDQLETAIRRSKTSLEQEEIIREAVGNGQLGQCGLIFKRLERASGGTKYLYGLMRCHSIYQDFMAFSQQGLPLPTKELGDVTGVHQSVSHVPKVLGKDASAIAAYYVWIRLNRESGMSPPKKTKTQRVFMIDGKPRSVTFSKIIADPSMVARQNELYSIAKKLDPENPFVLKIASERSKGNAALSYQYMKRSYVAGGNRLFPEEALFAMAELAAKLRRADLARAHEEELVNLLRAKNDSVWTRYFYFRHPNYKK